MESPNSKSFYIVAHMKYVNMSKKLVKGTVSPYKYIFSNGDPCYPIKYVGDVFL